MPLIPHSHAERLARKADKRRRLLGFLRTEFWTTLGIVGTLLEIKDRTAIRDTLKSMARDGFVVVEEISLLSGRRVKVVGLTMNGQAMAAATTGKPVIPRAYERGRLPLTRFDHRTDLQRLRIAAARAGWKGWFYCDQITAEQRKSSKRHRADALLTHPAGQRVALEVERHTKTGKRYQVIIGDHLSAIAEGQYNHVVWAVPSTELVEVLRQLITGIPRVIVGGIDTRMGQQQHAHFTFCNYSQFPNLTI